MSHHLSHHPRAKHAFSLASHRILELRRLSPHKNTARPPPLISASTLATTQQSPQQQKHENVRPSQPYTHADASTHTDTNTHRLKHAHRHNQTHSRGTSGGGERGEGEGGGKRLPRRGMPTICIHCIRKRPDSVSRDLLGASTLFGNSHHSPQHTLLCYTLATAAASAVL